MELSIVTTLFHSAPYIDQFYHKISAAATKITSDYELVFVNDGSPDHSLDTVLEIYKRDPKVRVIDLSRNFGHHKAMMTGLMHAKGNLVFLIDSDLEENPDLLLAFYDEFKRSHPDVVYGVQQSRKGLLFERLSGYLFYSLFNILSSFPIPRNVITTRLMSREYVRALVAHQDREVCMVGLWAITGFTQVPFPVEKTHKGSSTYNIARKVSAFVNALTSFSNKPLVFIFYLGCMIVTTASAAASYLIVRRIFFGEYLSGWPSLIVSIWLIGGLTIFCLGILGIYVSKIFMETKARPYTTIRKYYEQKSDCDNEIS